MSHNYEIVDTIGTGHYGDVYRVRKHEQCSPKEDKQFEYFAMKKILKGKEEMDIESTILPHLQHPNIIETIEVIKEKQSLMIILQYASQGDLEKYCRTKYKDSLIPERVIVNWLAQMCLGLYYLHNELQIIHRDIKMKNVLVMPNGLLKLADFGVARKLEKEEDFAKSTVGTPYYLSPEALNIGKYNNKSDVWALGCLLFQLCTGERPFSGISLGQIFANIIKNSADDISSFYSKWLSNLVKSMLQKNPEKRISIQSILQYKEIREEFFKLKSQYKEYEGIIYPETSLRTTKYYEREEKMVMNMKIFAESLKTAKKDKSIRLEVEDKFNKQLNNASKTRKIEFTKFLDKSLKSLIEKSQKHVQ